MTGHKKQMKPAVPKFTGLKKTFFEDVLAIEPVELAYLFVRGATDNERLLITEALETASPGYREIARHYIQNSELFETDAELRKKFSELEHKTE